MTNLMNKIFRWVHIWLGIAVIGGIIFLPFKVNSADENESLFDRFILAGGTMRSYTPIEFVKNVVIMGKLSTQRKTILGNNRADTIQLNGKVISKKGDIRLNDNVKILGSVTLREPLTANNIASNGVVKGITAGPNIAITDDGDGMFTISGATSISSEATAIKYSAGDGLTLTDTTFAAVLGSTIESSEIANDAVTSVQLAANSVTADELADNSVTGAKITVDAVTAEELAANSVTGSEIIVNAVGDAVTSAEIAADAIGAEEIATDAVTGAEIAVDAVGANELANDSITSAELAADSVNTNELVNGAVTSVKIANDAVNSTHIATDTITADELAANSVTSAEIAADAVGTDEISNDAVTGAEIAADAVTSSELANDSVTSAELAADSVKTSELANDVVTSAKILDATITASDIADDTITAAKIALDGVTTSEILDSTILFSDIDSTGTLVGDPVLPAGGCYFATLGIICEGATADTNETLLTMTDPSTDRTITFPDADITVNAAADLSGTTLATNVVNSSLTAVGALSSGSIASGFGTIDIGTNTLTAGTALLSGAVINTFRVGSEGSQITKLAIYSQDLTPSSVANKTCAEQTFTVTGLSTNDKVMVTPAATGNAVGVGAARASATDTVAITFCNPSSGALTPNSGTYSFIVLSNALAM